MMTPDSAISTMQRLVWLCSWIRLNVSLSSTIDLVLLAWIAWMEHQSLRLDRLNHSLYKEFFSERTRWYRARGKTKPSPSAVSLPVGEGDLVPEVVIDETLGDA